MYIKWIYTLCPLDKRICHYVFSLIVVCLSILPLMKKKHLQKNNINCNWELQLSKTWKHTSRVSLVFNYFIPKKDYTIYSHWVEGFCLCVSSLKHANILLCVLLNCYLFVLYAIDKFVKEQLQQQPCNISTKLKKMMQELELWVVSILGRQCSTT